MRCRLVAALWTLLLSSALTGVAPAAAEDAPEGAGEPAAEAPAAPPETAEVTPRREGAFGVKRLGPGEVVVVEGDDLDALGDALDPWESDELVVHGGAGADEEPIRVHGADDGDAAIKTHTGTSGDRSRIPTIRMGTSNDADIVVHGSGGRRPSRIKVHGHGD